jgi:hypothetical protein
VRTHFEYAGLLDTDQETTVLAGPANPLPGAGPDLTDGDAADYAHSPSDRTGELLSHGRPAARRPRLTRGRIIAIAAAGLALLIIVLIVALPGSKPAVWPASVGTVQREAARACRNPDVKSEPGQVNFACARGSRQILWVFALLTSGGNPKFTDNASGRVGLEPISPAQGGEIAWSLNLHRPYSPASPVDSIAVAARAINNIIGGATLSSSTTGSPVVQAGLEGTAANCRRYTGSAALTSLRGFPSRCAQPVTSPAGQAALVADVFRRWVVGASTRQVQDAVVLFQHATDPGSTQVQAILHHLPRL